MTHFHDDLCPFCILNIHCNGVGFVNQNYFPDDWIPQLIKRIDLRRQYDINVTQALRNHNRVLDENKRDHYDVKINAYLRNPKNALEAHPETYNFSRPYTSAEHMAIINSERTQKEALERITNTVLQRSKCPCGHPLKFPFKLCYTCNMAQKSKYCPCGNPIKATFKQCYRCHMAQR